LHGAKWKATDVEKDHRPTPQSHLSPTEGTLPRHGGSQDAGGIAANLGRHIAVILARAEDPEATLNE